MTERYSNLKYKVHISEQPLDKAFPELFRSTEMKQLKFYQTWEKITKYIVFLYSKETGLFDEYQSDLTERKMAAAIDAGYAKTKAGTWPEDIQDIMDVKNKKVNAAILAFLKQQNHVVWTEITITQQELFEFQKLRFMSIDTGEKKRRKKNEDKEEVIEKASSDKDIYEAAKKKDALMSACNERIKALEQLYVQFYGDSKKDLISAEFEEMITPEKAERILTKQNEKI